MQSRILGSTGIRVSCIGLGTVKFGRNHGVKYPQSFELPSKKDLKNLLALARDGGINLLDTAPAYGESEVRLGELLKTSRQDWVICTKVGETFAHNQSAFDFSAPAITKSVEQSLQKLRTDYIDCVLVHSNGEDEKLITEDGVFLTLQDLKKAGKLRAFGMSTKTIAGGMLALAESDCAMVTYYDGYMDEKVIIDYAEKIQKGILIKKAFNSGHLVNSMDAKQALQFVLQTPGVSSVIIGTINPLHLQENINNVSAISAAKI